MNEQDIATLTKLLKQLEPGFLPYDVFVQMARLNVLSIIEFVPMRRTPDGTVEVLLLSRGPEDSIWPNMLHTPGTVIRPTDTEGELYIAFQRILKDELDDTPVSQPHYVGSVLHKSRRGTEHAQIYWVVSFVLIWVLGKQLPSELIEEQKKFINLAVDSFTKNT